MPFNPRPEPIPPGRTTSPEPALSASPGSVRRADPELVDAALSALDNLASHLLEQSDWESLEAGCLSCSFSKIEDRQL
jgi:hypothetical protein